MTEVWSDGQAGATAIPRTLDLGVYDAALVDVVVTGRRLIQDTRQLEPGDIFVALGNPALDHVDEAIALGASAALVSDDAVNSNPTIVHRIADLANVLPAMADDFAGHPSAAMTVVGITGTNGKTSTAHLLTEAWEALGRVGATIGTLGAGITGQPRINMGMTTPQVTTVQQFLADFFAAGVEAVAVEVSSHALHQGRVAGVNFEIIVFTNLTRDHLDYHGTMAEYAAQKAKIFTLPGTRTAIVNLDDPFGAQHFGAGPASVRWIGLSSNGHPDAVVQAHNVRFDPAGLSFDLVVDGITAPVRSELIGRFNVDNLLAVAGVLHGQGFDTNRIAEVLGALPPVLGRMTRIHPDPAFPLVVVDAGHTPDAVRQAVSALRQSGYARIVTVFGATGDRDPGKRPEMARIAEEGSELVIVTDDDVHNEDGDRILDDIRRGFHHPEAVVEIRDRTAAIAYAIDAAGPADVVLLQGKGHEPYQIIGDARVPFSDLDTARRLLQERSARR